MSKEQKENEPSQLELLISILNVRNNTYNLFGRKPFAFEKSMLKNLQSAGLFIYKLNTQNQKSAKEVLSEWIDFSDDPFAEKDVLGAMNEFSNGLQSQIEKLEKENRELKAIIEFGDGMIVQLRNEKTKLKEALINLIIGIEGLPIKVLNEQVIKAEQALNK